METFSALLAICAGNSPVPGEFPHKGQWRGAFMFSLICAWINRWVNNREAVDFRRYRTHYDVIVMCFVRLFEETQFFLIDGLCDQWEIIVINDHRVVENCIKQVKVLLQQFCIFVKRGLVSAHFLTSRKTFCDNDIFIKLANSNVSSLSSCFALYIKLLHVKHDLLGTHGDLRHGNGRSSVTQGDFPALHYTEVIKTASSVNTMGCRKVISSAVPTKCL